MDLKKHEDLMAQMIRRLVSGDFHTAKGSAAAIIPGVYLHVSSNFQNELINIYLNLCNDEIPLARKYASMNLKDLMKFISSGNETELINSVKSLMKDDQDFVKLYVVDALVELAKGISP
mmetsp:Transcript_58471/g.81104  ORF Transcript_58471/g.81104 Transcript_58471/m.81104 type:complete len:119 (+) Transcript_58471:60-416(+)